MRTRWLAAALFVVGLVGCGPNDPPTSGGRTGDGVGGSIA